MYRQGIEGFPYYLGINSLSEVATLEDRVVVLNVMGGESRPVTPTSHSFSGGNVVFGTSPGRSGQVLKTPAGDIPVYNNVREGLDAGHSFNTGVVYLPPSGVRDGVAGVPGGLRAPGFHGVAPAGNPPPSRRGAASEAAERRRSI